jgi:serine/threonine protein phosphatase PrpC
MGIYLATPNKEKNTVQDTYQNMRYAASGMQGWRVNMEDAHIAKFNIAPDTHIFGVFDGHGGKEVARYAEKHFIDELLANKSFKDKNYPQALTETFLRIDDLIQTNEGRKELMQLKQGDGDSKSDFSNDSYAGCTACVALMAKGTIYCANAGDSRCVLFTKGTAIALSEDHKPEVESERARIQKAGGYVVDGRINGNLNLSRALGDLEYKKNTDLKVGEQLIIAVPEIKQRALSTDDEFLLIGCDGIWECLTNQQICEFVAEKYKEKKNLGPAIECLLDRILAPDTSTGLGCDNMSCICVLLK